jgi:hypothetical protein
VSEAVQHGVVHERVGEGELPGDLFTQQAGVHRFVQCVDSVVDVKAHD